MTFAQPVDRRDGFLDTPCGEIVERPNCVCGISRVHLTDRSLFHLFALVHPLFLQLIEASSRHGLTCAEFRSDLIAFDPVEQISKQPPLGPF